MATRPRLTTPNRIRRVAVIAGLYATLAGCSMILGIDDLPSAIDSSDAASDSSETSSDAVDEHKVVAFDAASCPPSWTVAPVVDPSITVHGNVLLHLVASGNQDYMCVTGSGSSWQFVGPEGDMLDCNNDKVGDQNYVGSNEQWTTFSDNSSVTGIKEQSFAPDAGGLPWLLFSAVNGGGPGTIASTTAIQRLNTSGGVTPPIGECTGSGVVQKVPYTADYWFYGVADASVQDAPIGG